MWATYRTEDEAESAAESFRDSFAESFVAGRGRRVAVALVALWLLSLADLYLTLWASAHTAFHEGNPLARPLLSAASPAGLIAYKLGLMTLGTLIFWRCRSNGRCELASWGTAAVYLLLAVRWSHYLAAC